MNYFIINRRGRVSILKNLILGFVIIFSIALFILGIVEDQENILFFSVITLWISMFFKNFGRERIIIFAFLITFFSFLLGTAIISYYDTSVELIITNHKTLVHIYISLYISLIFVHIGTMVKTEKKPFSGSVEKQRDTKRVEYASKYIYYILSLFSFLVVVERLIYTMKVGTYTSSYVEFATNLPSIIIKLSGMTSIVFFIFLATIPNPRNSKSVFIINFAISLLTLLYGQRSSIVMAILITIIYFILYEGIYNAPYSIVKRKWYIMMAIVFPFLLLGFDFIVSIRDGSSYEFRSIIQSVKSIISSLGGSVNVIGYGFEYVDYFPEGKWYSVGGIIDFLTGNIFSRSLFGTKVYAGNTVEAAIYGNHFSSAVTYIVKRSAFLRGYGLGSSYIAEAYHDFGYFGIALFSFIYGVILKKANSLIEGKVIRNAIILIAVNSIIMAPRSSADKFLSAYFNFSFILIMVVIYFLSKIVRVKKNKIDDLTNK